MSCRHPPSPPSSRTWPSSQDGFLMPPFLVCEQQRTPGYDADNAENPHIIMHNADDTGEGGLKPNVGNAAIDAGAHILA